MDHWGLLNLNFKLKCSLIKLKCVALPMFPQILRDTPYVFGKIKKTSAKIVSRPSGPRIKLY